MNVMLRVVLSLVMAVLGCISIFGFMATFEPLDADTQMTWRVIYGILFMVCLIGLILINRRCKQTPNDQETNNKSP